MKRIKGTAILTLVLCVLVGIGVLLSHLALTDIYHEIRPTRCASGTGMLDHFHYI